MITVVADDITGAAEIAGVCLRYGLQVSFGINSVPDTPADVCVIATDSRSATEIEAYNTHKKLATEIFTNSDSFVFKKCDSVLRGYVLTELAALMEISAKNNVILQPANPATGRCIRNSQYYIEEKLLEKTGFAIDPDFPARSSNVITLLSERSPLTRNQILITTKESESQAKSIQIDDCNSTEELNKNLSNFDKNQLYAGSAAFFEQILKKQFPLNTIKLAPSHSIVSDYLLIAGSTHPQSHIYIESLRSADCPVCYFPEELLRENTSDVTIESYANTLVSIWAKHRRLVLSISNKKVTFPGSSTILKMRINKIVSIILAQCPVAELLIEGGATAYDLLSTLKWQTLTPIQEISPGVVRMQIQYPTTIYLTIKPGSYQWPKDLIQH